MSLTQVFLTAGTLVCAGFVSFYIRKAGDVQNRWRSPQGLEYIFWCFFAVFFGTVFNLLLHPDEVSSNLSQKSGSSSIRQFTVRAPDGWQNSGIVVTPGLLQISADGKWGNGAYMRGSERFFPFYGPGGEPALELSQFRYVAPFAPVGALVGKIGPHGKEFMIGSGRADYKPSESGVLYLSMNDDARYFSDNRGMVTVTVSGDISPYGSVPGRSD